MVTKEQKQVTVNELVEKFKTASGYYLVDFTKMTVADSIRFRRELRKKGVDMKVAKNTLILRALKELGELAVPETVFKGQTAIIFGYDDPVSPSKVIKESFDKFQMPKLKGAVIEGQFFDASKLNVLASLPTKQDIYSSILGSLDSPVSGIVGSINAVIRDLASLVEEVAKKNVA